MCFVKYIKDHSTGFTLVELMLVLLLLGIVSAVAVPSINSTLNEMKLDSAAQEIVTAIHYVQSLAMKSGGMWGDMYGVEFFPTEDRYRCFNVTTDTTILHPIDKNPYDISFAGESHMNGVSMVMVTFGNKEVIFNGLGEPWESGEILLSYGDFQKAITISYPLGKVTYN